MIKLSLPWNSKVDYRDFSINIFRFVGIFLFQEEDTNEPDKFYCNMTLNKNSLMIVDKLIPKVLETHYEGYISQGVTGSVICTYEPHGKEPINRVFELDSTNIRSINEIESLTFVSQSTAFDPLRTDVSQGTHQFDIHQRYLERMYGRKNVTHVMELNDSIYSYVHNQDYNKCMWEFVYTRKNRKKL